MPTPDPGFAHYMRQAKTSIDEPHIEVTEHGWAWHTEDGERHELFAPFCTVHVNKSQFVKGMN